MRNADKQEARTESGRVLQSVVFNMMKDNMESFKKYNNDPAFKKMAVQHGVFDNI